MTLDDNTIITPKGSAYLKSVETKEEEEETFWYSFDGAQINEFAPKLNETGYSLVWTSEQVCRGQDEMTIQLDLKCGK